MYIRRNYPVKQFLFWTRRDLIFLFVVAIVPTALFTLLGWKWLVIPWLPIALIGTAVAFVIGLKNNASYDRMWEARRAWGAIVNASRSWGIMVKDYIRGSYSAQNIGESETKDIHKALIYRHLAWITALRYQLREPRGWEAMTKSYNVEYRQEHYSIEESNNDLDEQLARFLSENELSYIKEKKNKAAQIVNLQSAHLRELFEAGLIREFPHIELEKCLIEFYNQQGVCERIKNFPYPRQFATLNLFFVKLFVLMVPFGLLQEFDKLGTYMVWLNIPFSVLISWVFISMEKCGEATENPFEGSANDVPMTTLSRTIEIDLRDMLDEKDLPPALAPHDDILM